MPRIKDAVAERIQEEYSKRETILDKMKYLVNFAGPLLGRNMIPSVESTVHEVYKDLGRKILQLNPDERKELGFQWGQYIAEKQQSVLEQIKNKEDLNEDVIPLVNEGSFLGVFRGIDEEILSDEFRNSFQVGFKESNMKAWVPENTPAEKAEEIYEKNSRIVGPFIACTFKDLEKVTDYSADEVKKIIDVQQKKLTDTLSPDISSMKAYQEDLEERKAQFRKEDLPGDADGLFKAIDTYMEYVRKYADLDLSVATDEVRKIINKMVSLQEDTGDAVGAYLKSFDRTGLTDAQKNALISFSDLAEAVLGEYYSKYSKSIATVKEGYELYGSDTYSVKKGAYGSYVHYRSEGVWVEEYLMSHTNITPQSVTLPDGRVGDIYLNDTFNLKEELNQVVEEIGKRRPELKPFLKLNDEAVNALMASTDEKTKALKDFLFAFHPNNNIGANAKFKLTMAQDTIARYFLPAENGKLVDQPAFAEEIDNLYEKFYGLGNTQRELMYGHLLDKEGVALPMNGIHDGMGEMADMLGISEMVAPSERIPIVRDGKTVFVNFVEKVEGKSIQDPEKDNIFLDRKNNPLTSPEALKALADMQVLDYLCGTEYYNMDSDLVFKTDPENPKKITGIVRTGTGSTFGTFDPSTDAFGKRLDLSPSTAVSPNQLMVVNASMAEKVMALKPEDITKMMESKAFSPAQIEAAKMRLQQLQEKLRTPSVEIREGSIHIMTDAEWREKPLPDLMRDLVMSDEDKKLYQEADEETKKQMDAKLFVKEELANDNIFRKALGVRDLAKNAVAMDKQVHGKVHPSMDYKKGFGESVKVAQSLSVSMKEMLAELERNDPWYISSSKEFSEMKAAVKDYVKTFSEMSRRWKKTGTKTAEDMNTLAEKMRTVGQKAGVYRLSKDRNGVTGRTGPGRYAFSRQLEEYASRFEKQISKKAYRSVNDRRIDNLREYYGQKGLDSELLPELKKLGAVKAGQEKILTSVKVPEKGVGLNEDDFMYLAYTTVFNPEVSGSVRKKDVGVTDEELSPEKNTGTSTTFFTLDLVTDADTTRKGEYMPRAGVGKYFNTIEYSRKSVENALNLASNGNPTLLGTMLAKGMEEYREYYLDNCDNQLGELALVSARMMKGTVDFLERNPAVMEAAKKQGLRPETILKIKAKANYAELYDRSDTAKRRLKSADEKKLKLTEKERKECERDIAVYDMVKHEAEAEVRKAKNNPEYKARVNEAGLSVQNEIMEAQKNIKTEKDRKLFEKKQYILNAELDLVVSKGIGMPKAVLKLSKGIEEVQKQVEAQMNHTAAQNQPVQQGGPRI